MTSDPSSTTLHPPSFASLPREIRDDIYALTLTCEDIISLPFKLNADTAYGLLATKSSSPVYAAEARAFFFGNNKFSACATQLHRLLDPAHGPRFDIKCQLRIIHINIEYTNVVNEVVEKVRLLLSCPRLQEVDVSIYGLYRPHQSAEYFSNAFKLLETMLKGRLTFRWMDGYSTKVVKLEELRGHMDQEWKWIWNNGYGIDDSDRY